MSRVMINPGRGAQVAFTPEVGKLELLHQRRQRNIAREVEPGAESKEGETKQSTRSGRASLRMFIVIIHSSLTMQY